MCGILLFITKEKPYEFKIFIIQKKKKKKIARKKPKFKEFYIETIKCNLEISCSFKNLK